MTIYDKYGGEDFFHDCIYSLYLNMFAHPEIAYHFIDVDMEKLSRHQTHYLIQHIGGPALYKGRSMEIVHKHMGITLFQFKEIAEAFREVFMSKGVEKADVDVIMSFIGSHQTQIVTRKTSILDRIMVPIYRFLRRYF